MTKIGIIMGSQSDLSIMNDAANILKELGVAYEITVGICPSHTRPPVQLC
jgi:5-(carboxyamino)imidazole ribonucleotide mutase